MIILMYIYDTITITDAYLQFKWTLNVIDIFQELVYNFVLRFVIFLMKSLLYFLGFICTKENNILWISKLTELIVNRNYRVQ